MHKRIVFDPPCNATSEGGDKGPVYDNKAIKRTDGRQRDSKTALLQQAARPQKDEMQRSQ